MVILLSAALVVVAAVLLVLQFLQGGDFGLVYTAMGLAAASMVLLQLARWMGSRPEGPRRAAPEPLSELVAAHGPTARDQVERGVSRGSGDAEGRELLWAPAAPSPVEISAGTPVLEQPAAESSHPVPARVAAADAEDTAVPVETVVRTTLASGSVPAAPVAETPVVGADPAAAGGAPPAEPAPAPAAAPSPPGAPAGGPARVRTFLGRRSGSLEIGITRSPRGSGSGR